MKITKDMIHPSIRKRGILMRRMMPLMGKRMIRMSNRFLEIFAAGKAHTKKAVYRQEFILRPDGSKLRVCVYLPKEKKNDLPGLLWMHGGGYALGIPEQDIGFIETFMAACDCVIVAPDYTRSSEACYPAALDDCYLALKWMKEQSLNLGINAEKLMVGGDSAGGGLAAALCLYARDKGVINIAFQMPLYPMLDHRETGSSADNDAPVWNSRQNTAAWKMYLGNNFETENVSKYASPALEQDHHGLPPAFTYVGTLEPFYDETLAYVKNLKEAGCAVSCAVYDGCYHGFDIVCPKSVCAKKARKELARQFAYAAKHYTAVDPGMTEVYKVAEEMIK